VERRRERGKGETVHERQRRDIGGRHGGKETERSYREKDRGEKNKTKY
jgi:hypothetical protein